MLYILHCVQYAKLLVVKFLGNLLLLQLGEGPFQPAYRRKRTQSL